MSAQDDDRSGYEAHGRLDPPDWAAFRDRAHAMLDRALDHLQAAGTGRVWSPVPDDLEARLQARLPASGTPPERVDADLARLMPHGAGNLHPRFFGWVHGGGAPANLLAEMVAAAMNANCGGRNHVGPRIERQVIAWCRDLMGFPNSTSGLVVSGTSLATLIALKAARDDRLGRDVRDTGPGAHRAVAYASAEAHSCNARAFDMLGLGRDALRAVPVDASYRIDLAALDSAIRRDRDAGHTPFAVIGTAGTVNTGAIDDLAALADLATREGLWFHVDGAFGACAMLSNSHRTKLEGLSRADSLAFDFHKWLQVNYDAGAVLIRSETAHRQAFADRPDYLKSTPEGLAAGAPWPVDYGPELSRGFRALKVWAHLLEFGPERLAGVIEANCRQAQTLRERVESQPHLELMAPVSLNICCFRHLAPGWSDAAVDTLNAAIVLALQMNGLAAPSTTRLGGRTAIRINLTHHRTRDADLDLLLEAVLAEGAARIAAGAPPPSGTGSR